MDAEQTEDGMQVFGEFEERGKRKEERGKRKEEGGATDVVLVELFVYG